MGVSRQLVLGLLLIATSFLPLVSLAPAPATGDDNNNLELQIIPDNSTSIPRFPNGTAIFGENINNNGTNGTVFYLHIYTFNHS
jgi:hypothetical protein